MIKKGLFCQTSVTVLHSSSAFFQYRSTCQAKEICAHGNWHSL